MKKGSQSSTPSGYIGVIEYAPATTTAARYTAGRASGGDATSYENKSQVSYSDKQSGSYARETATEKATAGEFRWKDGTSGNRSEYKQTETVRVGYKRGYTEFYNEQRIRDVKYNHHNYGGKDAVNNELGACSVGYGENDGASSEEDGACSEKEGSYDENEGACSEEDGTCSEEDSACDGDDGACNDDDDACNEDGGAYSDDCGGYSDDGGAYSDDDGYDSSY